MNLVKDLWTEKEKQEFIEYLESLKKIDKIEWTKNIINTSMEVLAIDSKTLKNISKEILKGNYLSFLDLQIYDYYECTIININIISKIKDFKIQKIYLDKYVKKIDNWASVDSYKPNIKNNENNYLNLAKKYINSNKTFIKRMGIIILFNYLNKKEYLNKVFSLIKNEDDYYVNMAYSWLLCECFIKNREETINYLNIAKLNKFVINKFILKARDSYRVTKEDKEMLIKYRIK